MFRTNINNDSSQLSHAYNQEQINQPSQTIMTNQQQNLPRSSEGQISRSFRALEQDLSSIQGTSQTPKSIFDQRRQQQTPGFRSVKPPEEVPSEQQRRPYHTDYEIEHVQQKWLEPNTNDTRQYQKQKGSVSFSFPNVQ